MATSEIRTRKPKILFFDIETTPLIGYAWRKWDTNLINILDDFYILSVGYQWEGSEEQVQILPNFELYRDDPNNDQSLVAFIWDLFDTADVVIGHNSNSFDIKKVNARFLYHKIRPPAPYKSVDTLGIARKHFKMTSNKLDDIGQHLGVGGKIKHSGFQMWLDVMAGDMKAWKEMAKYNLRDITLLRDVYMAMRPWIRTHPNMNLLQGTMYACPNCGSFNVYKNGTSRTRVTEWQQYHCKDCKAWSKAPKFKIHR